ncbi:hypothetical protein ZIOFF_052417 [Zingiber officinale]|uniref:Pinin/SDK/MemA protein domain-containing protein n=1 Tax=Zingiber officinale TaxID=94328 RepID=A0A8J5KIL1_ZINOF|nr:hypothetical protein ZIOFF_052417 [Zingiber officinale]
MASSAAEKTADELRKEIQELHRRQREITERLRDPRGIRRGGLAQGSAAGPRNRGVVRPAVDAEDQPPQKRRLSSAIVKLEDGEIKEDAGAAEGGNTEDPLSRGGIAANMDRNDQNMSYPQSNVGGFRRDGGSRMRRMDIDMALPEPTPREPKLIQDASLIKRNKRMLGQLLGTLEAEEKAREESEKLRQQEREQIAEKRKRDLTLRARVAAKAQEKKWELMFLSWSEHHKKLSNFLRFRCLPTFIWKYPTVVFASSDLNEFLDYCLFSAFIKWKTARRAELSDYQKQIEEQFLSNVEKQLERWQNARNNRRADSLVNLQETMDKELETHQLEHGPKTRRIAGGNDDEEDVEDIAAEDELMDEVLGAHDQERIDADATKISDVDNGN